MAKAKYLSEKEFKLVLAVIAQGRNPARNRIMFMLSHLSGMRVGEIAALKIGDILDQQGNVMNEIRLSADQTKGNRSRSVIISERLKRELKDYVSTIKINDSNKPFIRSQKSRSGFSANSLAQEFMKIYQRAGIKGASSHSGRRSFITNLANKGISVRILQSLAGHRSIATTQHYIEVNDGLLRTAVNML